MTTLALLELKPGEQGFWPQMMMAAGVFLLLTVVMFNLRKRMSRRRSSEQENPREKVERVRQTNVMRNDLREMMVELEGLTRRFSAQLDAKTVALERQIEKAEAKIAELRRLTGEPEGESSADGRPKAAAPVRRTAKPQTGEIPARLEPDEVDPLASRIYEMSDHGRTALQIARELGEHVGKVELILALRQQSV